MNFGMPGNSLVDDMVGRTIPVQEAHYLATAAHAYEQRTANLIAIATATYADGTAMFPELQGADGELKQQIKGRLGF